MYQLLWWWWQFRYFVINSLHIHGVWETICDAVASSCGLNLCSKFLRCSHSSISGMLVWSTPSSPPAPPPIDADETVADPGEVLRGPCPPPSPVQTSHKKDGHQKRPHRFHVSCPPYPATGSDAAKTQTLRVNAPLRFRRFTRFIQQSLNPLIKSIISPVIKPLLTTPRQPSSRTLNLPWQPLLVSNALMFIDFRCVWSGCERLEGLCQVCSGGSQIS